MLKIRSPEIAQKAVDERGQFGKPLVSLNFHLAGRTRTMAFVVFIIGLIYFFTPARSAKSQWGFQQGDHIRDACPNFKDYASRTHPPFSDGPLRLPFQRPIEACRTFRSQVVEEIIANMHERMVDKDLARLFENCFPNTLDTTVRWMYDGNTPQSFIVTGDINAEWLRDSTNQLVPYLPLITKDDHLNHLVRGAINTQADYIIQSPYCNAFQPPRGSGMTPSNNEQNDKVHPVYDHSVVFECKYELDSLASFLSLSWRYYNLTEDTSFMKTRWLRAVQNVLRVVQDQSHGTFNHDGYFQRPAYTFQRNTNIGTETLPLAGVGNPLASNTSLVRSAFRPSDDATILGFLIPANAFMSVELQHLGTLLRLAGYRQLAEEAEAKGKAMEESIWKHGVVLHGKYNRVFAYETDGYGSHIMMDDANLPSLLSLPKLGFVERSDPVYQNTRKMILEKTGNPYYLTGNTMSGVGGPHIGLRHAWPMSSLMRILTSDDDDEIKEALQLVKRSTGGLGLMHESVNVRFTSDYTRSWFAWANTLFGETISDLAERKPHLLFADMDGPTEE